MFYLLFFPEWDPGTLIHRHQSWSPQRVAIKPTLSLQHKGNHISLKCRGNLNVCSCLAWLRCHIALPRTPTQRTSCRLLMSKQISWKHGGVLRNTTRARQAGWQRAALCHRDWAASGTTPEAGHSMGATQESLLPPSMFLMQAWGTDLALCRHFCVWAACYKTLIITVHVSIAIGNLSKGCTALFLDFPKTFSVCAPFWSQLCRTYLFLSLLCLSSPWWFQLLSSCFSSALCSVYFCLCPVVCPLLTLII